LRFTILKNDQKTKRKPVRSLPMSIKAHQAMELEKLEADFEQQKLAKLVSIEASLSKERLEELEQELLAYSKGNLRYEA